jgi:mRNA-degrading endonuclease RelE of RelBE toxin-antitoxin system
MEIFFKPTFIKDFKKLPKDFYRIGFKKINKLYCLLNFNVFHNLDYDIIILLN